ncbi:MAG: HupE/UreJ family protein [Candidatus Paceibacterota bacterium]
MKKFLIAAILSLSLLSVYAHTASAHNLIPPELATYIQQHPNATPEEVKAFADTQSPEFAKKFRDGAAIVNIVRNQQTSFFDNVIDFIKLGVGHILSGVDHILFVLSLLLVFVSIRDILRLTATFTVAHSITLVLSGAGILTISPRITEPLIALSIVYVALTSVFLRNNKYIGGQRGKIASVFFFGLFHGLGFAGLLKEIQIPPDKFISSLFSFNVGIEMGQLVIIAIALPIIYVFRNKPWYPTFIKIFAILIAAIALFWVIQRVFFV